MSEIVQMTQGQLHSQSDALWSMKIGPISGTGQINRSEGWNAFRKSMSQIVQMTQGQFDSPRNALYMFLRRLFKINY